MNSKIFNIYLNSNDKLTGSTNNNANFNIDFNTLLPKDNNPYYKVSFSFQCNSGYFKDTISGTQNLTYSNYTKLYNNIKILTNFQCGNVSYDSTTKSQSLILGYANRDIQNASGYSTGNSYNCWFDYNAPKIIMKPTTNILNVQLINSFDNSFLTDTNSTGVAFSDTTPWTMILMFEQI